MQALTPVGQNIGNDISNCDGLSHDSSVNRLVAANNGGGTIAQLPDSTREKLANYTGQVPWSYLAPHAAKGSLYFVDPALELADVGAAFSQNRADRVEGWLQAGDLVKIEALHAAQWGNSATEFEVLVVTPFVLCRPV